MTLRSALHRWIHTSMDTMISALDVSLFMFLTYSDIADDTKLCRKIDFTEDIRILQEVQVKLFS